MAKSFFQFQIQFQTLVLLNPDIRYTVLSNFKPINMSLKWTIQFVVDAQLVKELNSEGVYFRKISIFFVI